MGDSDPDAAAAGGVVGKMVGQEGGLSAATEAEWPFLAKMCSML